MGGITTNKPSGGDGIPVELCQIQKDEAVKVLHSICQQIWKIQQWPRDWATFQSQRRQCQRMLKLHASKVMLKILQASCQQYMIHELSDVQAAFRKGIGTRDQIANIHWTIKKARVPE